MCVSLVWCGVAWCGVAWHVLRYGGVWHGMNLLASTMAHSALCSLWDSGFLSSKYVEDFEEHKAKYLAVR